MTKRYGILRMRVHDGAERGQIEVLHDVHKSGYETLRLPRVHVGELQDLRMVTMVASRGPQVDVFVC